MTDDDRGKAKSGACGAPGGGYTIFLDDERIRGFMASGDPSSASELDHFAEVGAQLEKRIKERSGAVILALAASEQTISRDFAVLQIAHLIAKHGKNVLIVDGDFLHAGLSGLVENIEEHGFLDLLLYGSSLKSVARSIGIEGVSVAGPGSFPVARTVPFAIKEFERIMAYLRAKHDVVIYCSTLYTEDAKINPIARLADGILLCCRIDDMSEGELQKDLKALGDEKVAGIDLVCFCGKRDQAKAAPAKETSAAGPGAPAAVVGVTPPEKEEPLGIPLLEKSEELEPLEELAREKKPRANVLRIVSISAAAVILAFVVWWAVLNRTVREREPLGTTPGEVALGTGGGEPSRGADSAAVAADGAAVTPGGDTAAAIPQQPSTGSPAGSTPAESPRAPETSGAARTETAAGAYTIHVASFKELSRAEVEKAYLEENGFGARIVEVEIKGEMWLRVLVGEFATEQEAAKTRLDLLGLNKVGYARVVRVDAAAR